MTPPPAREDDAAGPITVRRARSPRAVEEFIDFQYRLRGNDARFIPPLRRDQRVLLDRLKHPFHQHAEVEYLLARRGGETVGRIAAIENHAHNIAHDERVGFFGFLEAVNDAEVFRALLGAAAKWCRARGLTAMRGPCSFSTNEECGLLVENFDSDPVVMMQFHPPHYMRHVEAAGFEKAEDLLCYWLTYDTYEGRILRLAEGVEKRLERAGIRTTVRCLEMDRWREEVDVVKRLYNKAWEKNWGFIPMTDPEMEFVAKELKPVVNPELIHFVEVEGEPVAFSLSLPDWNIVLKHMGGRLTPRSITTALLLRKNIHQLRLLMMGVLPEYRNRGLEILLYREIQQRAVAQGILEGELSWILERNRIMRKALEAMGAREYRRYRIYERAL